MPKLSEAELLARDAKRDLGAELFEDLLQSLREAKAIALGEMMARRFEVLPTDAKVVRE